MLIIISLIAVLIIREIMKKKKRNYKRTYLFSSVLNFPEEFKSSWSLVNSLRVCGGDSSYSIIFILFISLFLVNKPLHLKLFYYLFIIIFYVILPLLNAVVNRLSYYVNYEEEKKEIISDNEKVIENEIEDDNNISKTKKESSFLFSENFDELVNLLIDWTDILFSFITLNLIIEYTCYSGYSWFYAAGENSDFVVCIIYYYSI